MSLIITIPGAVEATIGATAPAVLTIGVGTPGATGPAGAAGPGVAVGGTAGQFLTKIDGTNFNTDWTTVNLSAYAVKANNLSDLASASTARTNLGLGTMATATASDYALLASPVFTGNPTAPTPTSGDNDTSIATTAFVQSAIIAGSAHAETLQAEVRNNTGATLAPFTVVYINGALGNKATVAKAQANAESTSAGTFAITESSIADNANGNVISAGVLANVDTSSFTDGDKLYLSPTVAGGVTTTKPSAPNHLVYVGVVTRSHPTLGTVSVRIQNGYELGEIHDVALASVTNNDLLVYETSTTLWKNKSFSTLGLLTSATAASTYAPIASPTFTGTVTIPAGAVIAQYAKTTSAVFTGKVTFGNPSTTAGSAYIELGSVAGTPFSTSDSQLWYNSSVNKIGYRDNTTNQLIASESYVSTSYAPKASPTFTGTVTIPAGASISGFAPLASPSLTGTPLSTTAAVDTNTTQIATTAFVVAQAGAATPLVDGTAAVGTSLRYARADHVHPTDTSRAPLDSPSLTGTPLSITAAADTNTTQIATTAYVVGQASATAPSALGTAAVGTSLKYARADHVHDIPLPVGGTTGQVLSKIDGTNYNVQWSTASSSGGSADVQVFSTPGSATWTKPAGKTMVWVRLYGPGAGGGSGTRQATTSIRGGGGGGGAGGYLEFFISAAALPATVTVNVGTGSAGGAAVTIDSTVGNIGTNAATSYSQFYIYRAGGGSPGLGGTNTAGGSGGAANATVVGGITGTAIPAGGTGGATAAPTSPATSTTAYHQSTSGGGGAGQAATVTTAVAGAAGAIKGNTQVGLMASVAGGSGGTTAGVVPTTGTSGVTNWYGGTGAGGGAYITGVAGMAGAVGGQPGGGGGGGSASDNGFNSGAGGAGGNGMVIVVSY